MKKYKITLYLTVTDETIERNKPNYDYANIDGITQSFLDLFGSDDNITDINVEEV